MDLEIENRLVNILERMEHLLIGLPASPFASQDNHLVTVEEAGRVLGLSRTKVWDLLSSGRLRSVRIGRARRIARSELERFIAEATTASTRGSAE